MKDIQNYPKDSPENKAAIVTMRQSNHTHSALEEAARVRISHIRHTKGGEETSDSDRVFAELAYDRAWNRYQWYLNFFKCLTIFGGFDSCREERARVCNQSES
jgi:hypothetical protein